MKNINRRRNSPNPAAETIFKYAENMNFPSSKKPACDQQDKENVHGDEYRPVAMKQFVSFLNALKTAATPPEFIQSQILAIPGWGIALKCK